MNKQTGYIVQITDDYELFETLSTNRAIDPRHVKTLKDSMKEHGVLINPVLVNAKMQVIDGQHRLNACKSLGKPVYYLMIGDYGIEEVQALNLNQKNWTYRDYAESFASMGYDHYQTLISFSEENDDFGFGSCMKLLQNSTTYRNASRKRIDEKRGETVTKKRQSFEEGTWEVTDYDKAVEWVEYLRDLGKYYSGYNRSVFVSAMIGLFNRKQFDKDEFLRKLSYQSNSLNDCTSVGDYLLLVEEIYNFKKRDKVNLRF